MSTFTATIRTYLLSYMTDENDILDGYATKDNFNGEWRHYNEIIDKTYNKIFEKMNLNVPVSDVFKKDFCKRFYNSEIGYEVFSQFFYQLESTINTECFNLFKMYDEIRNMIPKDMLTTIDMQNDNSAKSNNGGLGILANTPESNLNIIYNENDKTIRNADSLQENYSNQTAESHSHTKGFSGRSVYEMYNYYARMTDIQEQIFNIIENRCFIQVFGS